jgi:hypothetical protein
MAPPAEAISKCKKTERSSQVVERKFSKYFSFLLLKKTFSFSLFIDDDHTPPFCSHINNKKGKIVPLLI